MKNRYFEQYVALMSNELRFNKINYDNIYSSFLGIIDDESRWINEKDSLINKYNNSEKKFLKELEKATKKKVIENRIKGRCTSYHIEHLMNSGQALIWIAKYFKIEFNKNNITSTQYHNLILFNNTILKILLGY